MADNTRAHTDLCKRVIALIRAAGGYAIKNLGGLGQVRGRPDIEGCLGGRFVGVEVKTGKGELDANQRRHRDDILAAGGVFIEARSEEQTEDELVAAGLMTQRPIRSLFG